MSKKSPKDIVSSIFEDKKLLQDINKSNSGLPRAPNFYEFVTGSSYLGAKIYGRQLQFGINLFEDYCPYCSDVEFANNIFSDDDVELNFLNKVTLLEYGVCPKCKKSRVDFWHDPWLKQVSETLENPIFQNPNELDVCAGMRSGKTKTVIFLASYQNHRLLLMEPNPAAFYGNDFFMPGQDLQMTFVAVQLKQVFDVMWKDFMNVYENSRWFSEYEKYLKDLEYRKGVNLYKKSNVEKDPYIRFMDKGITVKCETPNIRALRGRTRFFASIDEIGWFDHDIESEKKTSLNASETYEALRKSLSSVKAAARAKRSKGYVDVPDAIAANISSPSAVTDMIMQLIKSKASHKLTYHYPTWEFNPKQTYEDLYREECDNEEAFERDYGAVPPFADSPYLSISEYLERNINHKYKQSSIISYKTEYTEDKISQQRSLKYMHLNVRPIVRELTIPRLLTIDTGYKNNSFAIGMSHYDRMEGQVVIDFCIEISPSFPRNKGYYVNFEDMYTHAIKPLFSFFNIKNIVFDRWNSLEYIHRLQKEVKDLDAVQKSLTWSDFINIRSRIMENFVRFPTPEMTITEFKTSASDIWDLVEERPITHLLVQFLTVREAGKKILKPKGGTDDLFRTVALAVDFFRDPQNIRRYSNYIGENIFVHESAENLGLRKSVAPQYYYNKPQHRKSDDKINPYGVRRGNK